MDIPASQTQPPRLLTAVRFAIRRHQLSRRTEQAYLDWVRRYVRFHHLRHPAEMGEGELVAFVTDLAARGRVAQSTQMQALSALLFLYREVLRRPVGDLRNLVRARAPGRLPVVLTREEVGKVLAELSGVPWLVAMLLYGSGGPLQARRSSVGSGSPPVGGDQLDTSGSAVVTAAPNHARSCGVHARNVPR